MSAVDVFRALTSSWSSASSSLWDDEDIWDSPTHLPLSLSVWAGRNERPFLSDSGVDCHGNESEQAWSPHPDGQWFLPHLGVYHLRKRRNERETCSRWNGQEKVGGVHPGLIGWTYAVCAGIYLFTRESLRKNAIAWFVVVLLAVVSHSDLIPGEYGSRIILLPFIPSDWTLHAFGMSGVLTSLLMQRYADRERPGRFIDMLCALGVGMLVLGLVSHPFWIISKIQATPTWLFYCLAMFFPLFGFFYWLTDVKGKTNWFDIIKPAGTATLTCYIIPYIWYAVQQRRHLHYPEALRCTGADQVPRVRLSLSG